MRSLSSDLINIILGVLASLFVSLIVICSNSIISFELADVFFISSLILCISTFYFGFKALPQRKSYEYECKVIENDANNKPEEIMKKIKENNKTRIAFGTFKKYAWYFIISISLSCLALCIGSYLDATNNSKVTELGIKKSSCAKDSGLESICPGTSKCNKN